MQDQEEKKQTLKDKMLEGAAAETVQRYGSAVKEYLVSYDGIDNETGKSLKRNLKDISLYKINSNYEKQNIQQQAGFSAEIKSVARKNADNIIKGKTNKVIRTDDLGSVNDQIFDIKEIDSNGDVIDGTGSQVKFVGNTPKKLLSKLKSPQYKKYFDANAVMDIADDDYDALMGTNGSQGIIDQEIEKIEKQISNAKKNGNESILSEKNEELDKLREIKRSVRKSGVTRAEAIEARRYPKLSTVKDITNTAHMAGLEQGKNCAIIFGGMSLVKNMVSCIKGEKNVEEAAMEVACDMGKSASVSYVTAFSGSVLKGVMQNSGSSYIRSLSKTNIATSMVETTMIVKRVIGKYAKGEISGGECVEMLGKQGVGELGSLMLSGVSTAAVAGVGSSSLVTVVAGMTGATFGYVAATAVYQELSTSLKEYELAKEERIRVEKECEKSICLIKQYRTEMNELVETYLTDNIHVFEDGFKQMDQFILDNDVNGFIRGNADIQKLLGREMQYANIEEFNELMLSDAAYRL